MYDAVLSCIHRMHKLKTLPMDHEPSREDLWDFILQLDDVLRLAIVNHPDFEKQLREVLKDWGTNDLVECCLEGGVDANSWVDSFSEHAGPLEEYVNSKGETSETSDYCNGDTPEIKGLLRRSMRRGIMDFILQLDDVLRLAIVNHPDFEKQLREVLKDYRR